MNPYMTISSKLFLAILLISISSQKNLCAAPAPARNSTQFSTTKTNSNLSETDNFTLTNKTTKPLYFQTFGKKTNSDTYELLSSQEPLLAHPNQTESLTITNSDDYEFIDVYMASTPWKLQGTEKKLLEALGLPSGHTKTRILRTIRRQTFFIHAVQEKSQNRTITLVRPASIKGPGSSPRLTEALKNNFVDYSTFERAGAVVIGA